MSRNENLQLCDTLMYLIDSWIRLDVTSELLPDKERLEFMLQFKEILTDEFEKSFRKDHPVYYEQVTKHKWRPYAEGAFDQLIKNKDGKIKRKRLASWPKNMSNLSDL